MRGGLGAAEEGLGFAEEGLGAAGLAEELDGAPGAGGVLLHLDGVAGVGGEHEELAVRHFELNFFSELQACLFGHGDVAEKELGAVGAGPCEALGCGVNGFGVVTVDLKDESKGIGYQVVIIDDQNTLFHKTPRAHLQ